MPKLDIGLASKLIKLDLHWNQIMGEIPSSIANLNVLKICKYIPLIFFHGF